MAVLAGWPSSPPQPILGSSRNASPPREELRDDPNNGCRGDQGGLNAGFHCI